jgi:hypothetical protein
MESALYFPPPLGDVGWGNDRLGELRPDRTGRPSQRDWTQPLRDKNHPSNSACVPRSCAETDGKRMSLRISFSAAGHALGFGPNLGYAFLNQCDCQFF